MTGSGATPGYARPLAGLCVLDLSQGIAGPYCGMLLAQYGAEVIKVEPGAGDWGRGLGQRVGDHTALSLSVNRGKRSIALDLKQAAGRALLADLAAGADVFIENFRPGVCTRLGVGYAQVKARNPRVVYVSVSAFGQTGPRSAQPGSDTVGQAFSGIMMVNRDAAGAPKSTGFYATDMATALYAFQAVAMALAARPHEAEGRHLDISLIHASAAFLGMKVIEGRLEGTSPAKVNVPAGSYRTRDGWIAITLTRESHFVALARALGRPAWADDERFANFAARAAHQAAIVAEVQDVLLGRPTAEWLEVLAQADVLCSPIHTVNEWAEDPHVRAVGAVTEAALDDGTRIPWVPVPGAIAPAAADPRERWPVVGGDARALLRERLGLDDARIDALVAEGVVLA